MNASVLAEDGAKVGTVELLDEVFAAKVNVPLMHQVVTAQLAAARSGSHSTKTRGEVRGGGRKPWRQKGTGRARHGSIREPQWAGGGIAHGPKPRSHVKAVNKKMRVVALRSALSARAGDEKVVVVEDPSFEAPSTKRAIKALQAWGVGGRALVVVPQGDAVTAYSVRNIPTADWITQDQLNCYDVLRADYVVFCRSALDSFQERALGRRTPDAPITALTADASEEDASSSEAPPSSDETAPASPEAAS